MLKFMYYCSCLDMQYVCHYCMKIDARAYVMFNFTKHTCSQVPKDVFFKGKSAHSTLVMLNMHFFYMIRPHFANEHITFSYPPLCLNECMHACMRAKICMCLIICDCSEVSIVVRDAM